MFPYLHFRVRPAGWRQKSRSRRGHEETVLHQPEGDRRQWPDSASRGSPGQCRCWRPKGKERSQGGPRDQQQDRTGKEKSRCWPARAAPNTRLMWNGKEHSRAFKDPFDLQGSESCCGPWWLQIHLGTPFVGWLTVHHWLSARIFYFQLPFWTTPWKKPPKIVFVFFFVFFN